MGGSTLTRTRRGRQRKTPLPEEGRRTRSGLERVAANVEGGHHDRLPVVVELDALDHPQLIAVDRLAAVNLLAIVTREDAVALGALCRRRVLVSFSHLHHTPFPNCRHL